VPPEESKAFLIALLGRALSSGLSFDSKYDFSYLAWDQSSDWSDPTYLLYLAVYTCFLTIFFIFFD